MKFLVLVLAILCPAFCRAEPAGDWAGVIATGHGDSRIVLHVSGPDTALKAAMDAPDRGTYQIPVESIRFYDSTLEFSISILDLKYSGVLQGNGTIVGNFTQNGSARTLVLEHTDAPRVLPPAEELAGSVTDGRYHHDATGVEFDLPEGWSFARTQFSVGSDGESIMLKGGKATLIGVHVRKENIYPENIARVLAVAVPN